MSDGIQLTDEADFLLCILYDDYKQRRKNGESAFDARFFGDPEFIQSELTPELSTFDIEEFVAELSQNGLLAVDYGDDTFSQIAIQTNGIAYMQHRFGRKADKHLQRIAALRTILFG